MILDTSHSSKIQNPHVRFLFKILNCLFMICGLVPLAFSQTLLTGQSEGMAFRVEKVVSGLGIPWGMTFLSPSEILFTEKNGKIGILNPKNGKMTRISGGPPVRDAGQGGLLDVAVPPNYAPGGWIYFTYSKNHQGQSVTALARARRKGNRLTDWKDLLVTRSQGEGGRHFGSRIAFDGAGYLFFTVGDRGFRPNGQDLSTHAGSVLRLHLDGRVPQDNPFVNRLNALPEIWSYGHRNPQGIAYDFVRKRLWIIEHGPRGGDEINWVLQGRNYGWPVISYGKEYWGPDQVGEGTHKEGMEQPTKYYVPSIAPGSLLLYSGKAFPRWQGNLLAGALKLTHLNRVTLNASGKAVGEERLLGALRERIRALIESPEGWLYFSTDRGRILRVRPAR